MKRKTKLVIASTGASLSLIIGGVGVASANSNSSTNAKSAIGADINGPFSHVLSVLVANGTITQAQSDAILKEAAAERTAQDASRIAERTAHETLVASTIGSDWPTILKRLQVGESLATIAGDKKDALIAALVTEATTEINKAVTDGRLTSAQATTIEANLQTRITAEVNGTGGMGRMMGGFGVDMGRGHDRGMGRMMGGFGGPGFNGGSDSNTGGIAS